MNNEKKQEIIRIIKKYRDTEYINVAADEILRLFSVSGSVCFSSDCFYNDKTMNTCVGDYAKCTVKQAHS